MTNKSVMESTHIKLNVWLQAFFLMASSKKGSMKWSRLSEQKFRVDKWSLCRG